MKRQGDFFCSSVVCRIEESASMLHLYDKFIAFASLADFNPAERRVRWHLCGQWLTRSDWLTNISNKSHSLNNAPLTPWLHDVCD